LRPGVGRRDECRLVRLSSVPSSNLDFVRSRLVRARLNNTYSCWAGGATPTPPSKRGGGSLIRFEDLLFILGRVVGEEARLSSIPLVRCTGCGATFPTRPPTRRHTLCLFVVVVGHHRTSHNQCDNNNRLVLSSRAKLGNKVIISAAHSCTKPAVLTSYTSP
jgi:hypothetical protein